MPIPKRVLNTLETIELSRFMEEHALTPDKKAYHDGWNDERVAREFSVKLNLKEPINFQHVNRMRLSVYGFNVATRHGASVNAEVLRVLSEIPIMNAAVNMNESMAAYRAAYNKWAHTLKEVCTKKE